MDPVALYERAATDAAAMVEKVGPEQRGARTPCAEWDVDALVTHMGGGTTYLSAALGLDADGASGNGDYRAAVARCVGTGSPARCDGTPTMSNESLDEAVRAMGHPGRRAMLRLARDDERSASELAEVACLSPSAASPHLKLLRETGLMHVRVDAKRRLYRVDLQRLAEVRAALDELWGDRLDALKTHAEADGPAARRRRRSA